MEQKTYRCIGVMTGNSLDAVDVVLTEFDGQSIKDICGLSIDIPIETGNRFRQLKFMLAQNGGDIDRIAGNKENRFDEIHDNYIKLVADTILPVSYTHLRAHET